MTAFGNYVDRVPLVERLSFRENGAGTYVGTVALPAGALILDVIVHAELALDGSDLGGSEGW